MQNGGITSKYSISVWYVYTLNKMFATERNDVTNFTQDAYDRSKRGYQASHLLVTFVNLKFDGKELNPGADFIKNDIMSVQNGDGRPVTVSELRTEYASHSDDGEFINTVYGYQMVNSAEEFWIEDCGGTISSPIGVQYLNPNTKNDAFLRVVLKQFLDLKCQHCLDVEDAHCEVHCETCFAQESVCDLCRNSGYSGVEWHWATRRCLRCQQSNLHCNRFHYLLLSSDMEDMNLKAAAQIVEDSA